MKRSGFTMVELIFVIIIIGILSAAAIPKFGDMKDRAKANSEIASLSSLDGAVMAAIEGQYEDFGNTEVNWHTYSDMNTTDAGNARAVHYASVNNEKNVLSNILKKGKNLKIVGFTPVNGSDAYSNNDGMYNDILIIKADASNNKTGIKQPKDAPGQDINGKPDRNDFWVFNPTGLDLTVSGYNAATPVVATTATAGSLTLVDVNGTTTINNAYIRLNGFSDNATALRAVTAVN